VALDFLTLYIVILLNSLTVSVIWAAVSYVYRSFITARIWLAGCLLSVIGGAVLSLQGNEGALVPAIVGNGFVIFGFCLFWVGVRHFYGAGGGWKASIAITIVSMLCMVAAFESWNWRNVVYATAQSVPMLLAAIFLLRRPERKLGDWIAAAAMLIGVGGHAVETALNFALMGGYTDRSFYNVVESYALLCVIFSGVVWNFGFVVMAMDRLRDEVAALASKDALTGLPNRHLFLERLAAEVMRSGRTGRPFAVFIIDLDLFKEINDEHGHAAGDDALRHLAHILSSHLRPTDFPARYGGDEFCAVLPETTAAQAKSCASALVEAVRSQPWRWQGRSFPLSVSLGAAVWSKASPTQPESLMEQADQALYAVKKRGRNGCEVFSPPLAQSNAA
jgi:diguanylate cyclase (GGDEF)-like protein